MKYNRRYTYLTYILICIIAIFYLVSSVSARERNVSVMLMSGVSHVVITGNQLLITDGYSKSKKSSGHFSINASNRRIIFGNKKFKDVITIKSLSNEPIKVNKKYYGGFIKIYNVGDKLRVINIINSEEYLVSVVRSEMSPNWPIEALKAQSVLARTYLFSSTKHGAICDVCATTHCQVYNGLLPGTKRIRQAVKSTKGEILTWGGTPARVFYHSDSGGAVTGAENVWGGRIPYLNTVFEPFKTSNPGAYWRAVCSKQYIEYKVNQHGYNIGGLKYIQIISRDPSGRVRKIAICGTKKTVYLSGMQLRILLGTTTIRSTLFDFKKLSSQLYIYNREANKQVISNKNKTERIVEQPYIYGVKTTSAEDIKNNICSMPDSEDKLVAMADAGYFSTQELMYMLSRPDLLNQHIQLANKRLETRKINSKKQAVVRDVPTVKQVHRMCKKTSSNKTPYRLDTSVLSLSKTAMNTNEIVFYGVGYGHGVGLSQWGAKTLADNGWEYRRILSLYFPGTSLKQ